ncbi:MAG TPA: hypothetical protein VMX36_09635 [Sedimentisphaerales bacterium]|nr:hypothetical protein [Sedimentisphaerales bacterium]
MTAKKKIEYHVGYPTVVANGVAYATAAGYSLIELVVIVVFLGIIAAIAVPRLNFSATSKQKADTIARKIVTDLRRTRRLAISDAADNTDGFALNMTASAPYSGYEIENLDTSGTVDSLTIDSDISCTGGTAFQFGPLGNLKAGSDTQLTVSASGKTFTITIAAGTGMVKCTEN